MNIYVSDSSKITEEYYKMKVERNDIVLEVDGIYYELSFMYFENLKQYCDTGIYIYMKNVFPVDDKIKGLKDGSIEPRDVEPIRVFKQDGKIYSLDNRRLYAFKQAGVSEIRVNWINPTTSKYSSIISRHFTTLTDGLSIIVR